MNQIIIHESFYNKTIKDKEIEDNIRHQCVAILQSVELEQLKIQQEKERIELEMAERENKIKARYELLHKMNTQTGLNFDYESTKIYSDIDLMVKYNTVLANTKEEPQVSCVNVKSQTKDTYSLLIENLTAQEVIEIKNILVLSNAIIKEI